MRVVLLPSISKTFLTSAYSVTHSETCFYVGEEECKDEKQGLTGPASTACACADISASACLLYCTGKDTRVLRCVARQQLFVVSQLVTSRDARTLLVYPSFLV
jgi:hypothetical protein